MGQRPLKPGAQRLDQAAANFIKPDWLIRRLDELDRLITDLTNMLELASIQAQRPDNPTKATEALINAQSVKQHLADVMAERQALLTGWRRRHEHRQL